MEYENLIKLIGLCFVLIGFILFLDVFFLAYNNPEKEVCVSINDWGEAKVEMFFFLPVMFLFGLWALFLNLKDVGVIK